jgi:hypothetical protein
MGNQVIFAVNHDNIDALEKENAGFSSLTHEHLMSPWVPRLFHSTSVERKYNHDNRRDGVVTSACFSSDQGVTFYINNQGLFYSSLFSFMTKENFDDGPNGLVDEAKSSLGYTFHLENFDISLSEKPVINNNSEGTVSVFGFFTDNYNALNEKENIVKMIVSAIKNKDWSLLPYKIQHILDLDKEQGALVRMKGNYFEHVLYPNINVKINSYSSLEILQHITIDESRYDNDQIISQISVNKSIFNGLGFNLIKIKASK